MSDICTQEYNWLIKDARSEKKFNYFYGRKIRKKIR